MHIDYLNLQSNQENIKLYLNSSGENDKGSTFTLLIGENGVHKTTLLGYIYKIFRGKFLNRDTKMKIIYTIENKTYRVDTFYKHDSGHNVIVDSFSRIDKMAKNYLDFQNYRRVMVNDALVREFINKMVVASIDSREKYEEIIGLFDYIGIDSNDLILSCRNRSRKSDHMYLRYLSDEKVILELNKLFDDLLKEHSFRTIYDEEDFRINIHYISESQSDDIESLKKIKAIERYVLFLFDQTDLVYSSKNGYSLIPLNKFFKYEKKSQIFKKIIYFFKESLSSDFF